MYDVDDCTVPTTLGFDLVGVSAGGKRRRFGTYESIMKAMKTKQAMESYSPEREEFTFKIVKVS